MFSRSAGLRAASRLSKRLNSHAAHASPAKEAPFHNKYNFNVSPPPIHSYWDRSNASILFLFVPLFVGLGYAGKYIGGNLQGFEGLRQFAESEKSPLKELKFGEAQTKKQD